MAFSHQTAFERLQSAHAHGRLAHAYLITGPIGSGKRELALALSGLILGCRADEVAHHPDAHFVQPESKSRRIVIDQIRELEQAIQRKPLLAGGKAVIISDAERMQPQAANAFLKTLEEPPSGCLILLLSSLPEAILETVLSRCVETSLRPTTAAVVAPEQAAIISALEKALLQAAPPTAGDAFRFTRVVQALIVEAKERISDENDSLLKQETSKYKQASEGSSWLQERAEQVKAMTEAGSVRERDRILQIIVDVLGQALRAQHGGPITHPAIQKLSENFPPTNILKRLDAMETLRRRLALGVQEALSLEGSFLEMIMIK